MPQAVRLKEEGGKLSRLGVEPLGEVLHSEPEAGTTRVVVDLAVHGDTSDLDLLGETIQRVDISSATRLSTIVGASSYAGTSTETGGVTGDENTSSSVITSVLSRTGVART